MNVLLAEFGFQVMFLFGHDPAVHEDQKRQHQEKNPIVVENETYGSTICERFKTSARRDCSPAPKTL